MKNTPDKPARSNSQDPWEPHEEASPRVSVDAVSYITYLTRQRLLTFEEERALAVRIARGDKRAKDRLVESNMRLVINIAKNYHSPLVPFEDLVQEGAIGLMTAAERFDPSKGYRFSTYATHWIRQSVSRAVDNKARAIRIPAHVSESLRKLERTRALWLREHGEEPTAETLAKELNITPRKLSALMAAGQDPVSLDMLVGDEENTTLASLINDRTAVNPQEVALAAEMQAALNNLMSVLTPRERAIMRKRLGFEDDSAQVLQEIGENLHISRERVRQIELQALKKLKYAARRTDLYGYISS